MTKDPVIILVEPQLAENVGMAARAMMNCGLSQMRLVNPREDHLCLKGRRASSGAEEILERARVYLSLREAIADLQQVYATTARHRDQVKEVYTADHAAVLLSRMADENMACGIMFGPERTGLTNEDVSLADAIINIPLNPRHCSLNLSQAVLLAGYEYYKTRMTAPAAQLITNGGDIADKEKMCRFFDFLEEKMQGCGNFKNEERHNKLVINLRNAFLRSKMTEQELNSIYGIINYLSNH